ncbi:HD domain-containing protein [Butyricicoccus sp.]|uniref:HD domain-containing protein n=1 Tax=Butyricicoccus sp. TaxID=2049021 RepID=UPI003F18BD3D
MRLTHTERNHLRTLLARYLSDEQVQQMRQYTQHGAVSTYDHCANVARVSYWANRRLKLGADEQALVTGALLHDFYLYDWHRKGDGTHRLHGFRHAARACENARKQFGIGLREQEIIRTHMWPLTLRAVPMSREACIVCAADKYCSLMETLFRRTGGAPICA